MGIKIIKDVDICTECVFSDWKNNCHWCRWYKDYLNNLNPCINAKQREKEVD